MKRLKIVLILATMPEEAFGWLLVEWMRGRPFPDGLGGFRNDSREAIVALKNEAKHLVDEQK